MDIYGLVGFPLGHSFSKKYFSKKFSSLNLRAEYRNFEIDCIEKFPQIFEGNDTIKGLNITIPYKEKVLPFLDELSPEAKAIGAVNVIKVIQTNNKRVLIGHNSDAYGFSETLKLLLQENHKTALILGTGGAAKAVNYALHQMAITTMYVSRYPKSSNEISYNDLDSKIISSSHIIVNTTPLGMYPKIEGFPDIPYGELTENHILYDLTYNPELTTFLKKGKEKGSQIINGLKMLELQAEKAYEIWHS
ncbi:MAG: shikimate dehydrogenase [Salinivirgaceae bacterium]|nr:shikimate dehydrogenase [Salinivirgaceae bacterium]